MKTELKPGEELTKEGLANQFKGLESVGGKLYLTNQRLVFESHAMNIQTGVTEIFLDQIVAIEKQWSRLLGIIPVVPNLIVIKTQVGENFKFVIYKRDEWSNAIQDQLSNY